MAKRCSSKRSLLQRKKKFPAIVRYRKAPRCSKPLRNYNATRASAARLRQGSKLWRDSVATRTAAICERLARFGHKLPFVPSRPQGQLQHSKRIRVARLAVGFRERYRPVILPASTHHEVADSAFWIIYAIRILGSKSLV